MKMARYVYVGSPKSKVVHLTGSKAYSSSGAVTFCGRLTESGWFYWLGRRNCPARTICKKCRK
jgi:hypothetical protein